MLSVADCNHHPLDVAACLHAEHEEALVATRLVGCRFGICRETKKKFFFSQ